MRHAATGDFNDAMIGHLPYVFAFVLSAAFLLLLVTFRSIVIPLKAIVLNLLSVGSAYGLLTLVFQHGLGEALGLGSGPIAAWLPLFLFVILFGLSMDYHVFILTRVREAFDRGMSTEDAVAHGIKSTAGVVTSAAIVMVAVFSMFAHVVRAADAADGHRPRGRRPDRRHDHPRRPAARHDEAARRLELVPAEEARLAAAGHRGAGGGCGAYRITEPPYTGRPNGNGGQLAAILAFMDSTPRNLAARAGRWSAQHRKKAIFGWLAFVIIAVFIGGSVGTKTLENDDLGIGESGRADDVVSEHFPRRADESVLVQSRGGARTDDPEFRDGRRATSSARLERTRYVQNVKNPYGRDNAGQLSKDGRSALVTFDVPGANAEDRVDPSLDAVAALDRKQHAASASSSSATAAPTRRSRRLSRTTSRRPRSPPCRSRS